MLEHLKDKCQNSRTSTAFGITDITEDEENRDIVREYVLQEESKISKRRSKLPLKFKVVLTLSRTEEVFFAP